MINIDYVNRINELIERLSCIVKAIKTLPGRLCSSDQTCESICLFVSLVVCNWTINDIGLGNIPLQNECLWHDFLIQGV